MSVSPITPTEDTLHAVVVHYASLEGLDQLGHRPQRVLAMTLCEDVDRLLRSPGVDARDIRVALARFRVWASRLYLNRGLDVGRDIFGRVTLAGEAIARVTADRGSVRDGLWHYFENGPRRIQLGLPVYLSLAMMVGVSLFTAWAIRSDPAKRGSLPRAPI